MNAPNRASRAHRSAIDSRAPRVILPIKMPPDLRHRLKVAAAEEGTTYAGLFTLLLDARDARLTRQRAAQVHPLHRPNVDEPKSAYPGGGARQHPAFAPKAGT